MIFDILENKLALDGFEPGVTLFRGTIPTDASIAVMTRGSLAGFSVDPNIANYHRGDIQVIVRHSDPAAGAAMAGRVGRVLAMRTAREHYAATAERGEVTLLSFTAESLPIEYPRLTGNGFEWSQTWKAVFTLKPLLT